MLSLLIPLKSLSSLVESDILLVIGKPCSCISLSLLEICMCFAVSGALSIPMASICIVQYPVSSCNAVQPQMLPIYWVSKDLTSPYADSSVCIKQIDFFIFHYSGSLILTEAFNGELSLLSHG